MSNVKFNALAALALLAGAPVVAQAAMVEMAETEMAAVNGQGIIGDAAGAVFGALIDPFTPSSSGTPAYTYNCGTTCPAGVPDNSTITVPAKGGDSNYLPDTIGGIVGDASADFGAGVAEIALQGPFRALGLIGQAKGTALDFLFFPISAPLDVAGNVFGALNDGVVGTASRILTAPLNAVFGPVNRYVDGVTGRFEATVDGAAYAVTEVKGALIAGAFASASQGASNNGLDFTARVFGRISQAQAGLTANRLADLSGKYGY